jgi:3-hydroxyisobutyrate dehydrogenase-like beta-hydroxyacid dehydrogenase
VVATHAGLSFTDVALMAPVPGKGVRTPALGSGPDARTFAERMLPFGMEVTVVGLEPGEAATHKLLRSVVVKGLAAVVIESIEAARAAGLADSTWENVVAQITSADEGFLRRIIEGTGTHAQRRRHEMAAAAELLESLGVDPVMTRSTVAGLDRVLLEGIPPLPADG